MTQPDELIFQLITPEGVFTLNYPPDGWMEYGTEWTRHERAGYGRKFVAELQFVADGYDILRDQYGKYGVEAAVQLYIQRLDAQTYAYDPYFLGDIDFSESEDSRFNGGFYTVQINEAGFAKMLAARAKDTYELELPETVHIDWPATAWQYAKWNYISEMKVWGNHICRDGSFTTIQTVRDDISSRELRAYDRTEVNRDSLNSSLTPLEWYLPTWKRFLILKYRGIESMGKAYYPITMKFKFVGSAVRIYGNEDDFTLQAYCTIWPNEDDNDDIIESGRIFRDQRWSKEFTFDGQEEKVEFEFEYTFNARDLSFQLNFEIDKAFNASVGYNVTGVLEMEGMSEPVLEPFTVKAISLYNAFAQLCQKIADPETVTVASGLMTSGRLKDMYLVSGDSARGIDSAVLKTSFNDLFDSLDAVYGVALFHDSVGVRLEEYAHAFRDELIADLGEVTDFSIRPYKEAMYNYIKVGGADTDYQASNGRFEFNTENDFALPLTRITDEKNSIGKYRTDSFGITDLRLSYNKKSTAADKSDNDVFIVHTKRDATGRLTPYDDQDIVGDAVQLQRKGIFNVFFSPKRCLMRLEGRLAGILQKTDGKAVYRTTAKTDAVLVSRMRGGEYEEAIPVTELDDCDIDLSKAVWWPQIYAFTASIPENIAELMSERVGGYLTFVHDGYKYKGFPLRVSEKPHADKEQELELIAFPEEPQEY